MGFSYFFPYKSVSDCTQFPLIHPLQALASDPPTIGFLSLPMYYYSLLWVNDKGSLFQGKILADAWWFLFSPLHTLISLLFNSPVSVFWLTEFIHGVNGCWAVIVCNALEGALQLVSQKWFFIFIWDEKRGRQCVLLSLLVGDTVPQIPDRKPLSSEGK